MAALKGRDGRKAPPSSGSGARPAAWWVAAWLAAFLLASYRHALTLPFISDDYIILDKTQRASFAAIWGTRDLVFNWYRPVSRELHYWVMARLFGIHELPFHIVSFALWIADLTLFYALARRVAGGRTAALATAAVAALASWAGPLLWVAGVQELWFILYALLFLHAFARRRTWWAAAALGLALLSKETAGVLPAIALAWALLVDRDRPRAALLRLAPFLALVLAWGLVHPRLLGRMWGPYRESLETVERPSLPSIAIRSTLALVNLEAWPAPETGWGPTLLRGLPGVAALAALALVGLRDMRPAARGAPAARDRTSAGPARAALRVRGLALCWGLLGSLPLFLPSIGWHAYYGLFGAFGVWLLVMHGLSRRPRLALALIGALAVLRPLRADTPSWDWASDAYQRRAGHFLGALRDDLLRQRPALPRHARLYFAQVPRNIGWVAGNGPALRVWYRDSTLVGGYYSYYRPRGAGEPAGPDYFFRFDSLGKWVEVVKGAEDVRAARERNPAWEPDHAELARLLGHAGDWAGAAAELGKLADAVPGDFQYPLNAAVCYERLGDSTAAARWYARAAALPGAGQEVRADARRLARWARP